MVLPSSWPHRLLRPLLRGLRAGPDAGRAARVLQPQRVPGQLGARGGPAGGVGATRAAAQGVFARQYAYEVRLMEAERQRRAEAARVTNEGRKAAKAAAARVCAAAVRAGLPPRPCRFPLVSQLFFPSLAHRCPCHYTARHCT
jgi:hypothetical protein